MTDLDRFRLIADPADPDGLPVGMSATIIQGKRSTPREVFFNCAACHTTDVHYQGQVLRVEGAPAHFDMAGFVIELLESLENTITTPAKLEVFLKRLAERRHGAGKAAVVKAYPDLALSEGDPEPAMLGKVTALIERDKARAGSEVAKVKLELATAEDVLRIGSARAFARPTTCWGAGVGSLRRDQPPLARARDARSLSRHPVEEADQQRPDGALRAGAVAVAVGDDDLVLLADRRAEDRHVDGGRLDRRHVGHGQRRGVDAGDLAPDRADCLRSPRHQRCGHGRWGDALYDSTA